MRKHRLLGVVIAVLLGIGGITLRPSSPHPATGADFGRSDIQLTSVTRHVALGHGAHGRVAYSATVHAAGFSSPVDAAAQADPFLLLTVHMVPLPPPPALPVVAARSSAPAAPSAGVWAELRQCESSDNYADNTGNGYYGAYQFSEATWESLGLGGLPSDAPPSVQDAAAQRLQASRGWGQWPVCSRRLGL